MKRILFIDHDAINSGSSVSMNYIIKAFLLHGFKVTVFSPKRGIYLDKLKALGVEVIPTKWKLMKDMNLRLLFTETYSPFTFNGFILCIKGMIKFFLGVWATAKVIAEVKPDILYINEYVVAQSAIASHIKNVKSMIHIRSLYMKGQFGIRQQIVAGCIAKYCDSIIAITEQEAMQILMRQPQASNKIEVIGEFLNENNFRTNYDTIVWKKQNKIPLDKKVVLTLVGIVPIKGGLDFMKAAEIVLKNNKDVVFLFAGETYNAERCESKKYYEDAMEIANKPHLKNQLIFLGSLSDPIPALASCDIYVSPFTASHFSRPSIEAWAQKKPVVSTNVRHATDLITHNVNGLLVDVGNVQQIADAVNSLLVNESLCERLGEAGYKKALAEFNAATNTNLIVAKALALIDEANDNRESHKQEI